MEHPFELWEACKLSSVIWRNPSAFQPTDDEQRVGGRFDDPDTHTYAHITRHQVREARRNACPARWMIQCVRHSFMSDS